MSVPTVAERMCGYGITPSFPLKITTANTICGFLGVDPEMSWAAFSRIMEQAAEPRAKVLARS